jgi:acyl-CoA synthetase (NDP forming)
VRRQGPPSGPSIDYLEALFSPRTVAVIGASDDSAKWGHILARRALSSRGDRTVLLVNRRGGRVLDEPAYPSA